jgi:hypothetical protein
MEPDATPTRTTAPAATGPLLGASSLRLCTGVTRSWVSIGEGYDGPRAGSALAVGVGRTGFLFPLRVVWGARGSGPSRAAGSPPSAVMGRAGGRAGLPVAAVARQDVGYVFGADAMKVQMQAAGTFPPECGG